MCNFWFCDFWNYVQKYNKILRIDEDCIYYSDYRDVFKLLIKTSGVGPKLALAILSHITPDDLCQTIVADNALSLSKLPGIGKKTAV